MNIQDLTYLITRLYICVCLVLYVDTSICDGTVDQNFTTLVTLLYTFHTRKAEELHESLRRRRHAS
jgi:hypothetical protein